MDPPNYALGVPVNPSIAGMWRRQHSPTDDCVIEPELEGTFLCRYCIVTETEKREREETLRNHLNESAIVEDNEEYIQSLIAMLHSHTIEESGEDRAENIEADVLDPLCATPATHPWTGRFSLMHSLRIS